MRRSRPGYASRTHANHSCEWNGTTAPLSATRRFQSSRSASNRPRSVTSATVMAAFTRIILSQNRFERRKRSPFARAEPHSSGQETPVPHLQGHHVPEKRPVEPLWIVSMTAEERLDPLATEVSPVQRARAEQQVSDHLPKRWMRFEPHGD